MTAATPDRTLDQRMEALAHANDIRTKRAHLKRDLRAGRMQAIALLADPPYWLQTMKVYDLLLAAPKLGRVKVNKILNRARVAPSKTIGGLSPRQREQLVLLASRTPGARMRPAAMHEATMEELAA